MKYTVYDTYREYRKTIQDRPIRVTPPTMVTLTLTVLQACYLRALLNAPNMQRVADGFGQTIDIFGTLATLREQLKPKAAPKKSTGPNYDYLKGGK